MHVIFVSECEKRALRRTRAVLDSYAVRIGRRTWVAPMTMEGLAELHTVLRRAATRQTAVACYQNEAARGMRLVWIVGARGRFAADGRVPVAVSRLRSGGADTPPWLRCVCLLALAAGLAHDLGKATRHFQHKLRTSQQQRDCARHEWLSVCLLHALDQGLDWNAAWQSLADGGSSVLLQRLQGVKSKPGPGNAQEALEYLVASHHRLFGDASGPGRSFCHVGLPSVKGSHVRTEGGLPPEYTQPHAGAPDALLERLRGLRARLQDMAAARAGADPTLFWWARLTLARPALIFADHTVSAQVCPTPPGADVCAANTSFVNGQRRCNQPLLWHLEAVARTAATAAWRMGRLAFGGDSALEGLQTASLEAVLAPADAAPRFRWQNRAAAALERWREAHPQEPCLVFNMAGTGSGKTRMNLRAACLLAREAAPRCAVALNLRSLTLQTGEALRKDCGILPEDTATVIGDDVTQKLFNWERNADGMRDEYGGDTEAPLVCHGETGPLPAWMEPFWRTPKERAVVGAPLLVSTIDFLAAAGDPDRQGHHVKALLRLLTSDLILDEIDGYESGALVAVLRLVQLCAFFGRNVICSSATLAQPTAEAVHAAWISGLQLRGALVDTSDKAVGDGGVIVVDDSLGPEELPAGHEDFVRQYAAHLARLTAGLRQAPPLRRAFLQAVEPSSQGFQAAVLQAVQRLHAANAWEFSPGRRASFGLVRMAHIRGAVVVARALAQALPGARIACYHAGDWRISRFHKERRLDQLLRRKNGDAHIRADVEIQEIVARAAGPDVPFIVVATPVEEVGRDHDFDWAVLEPSSAQSLVQAAGRVNRHRFLRLEGTYNIAILQYNLRHCENCGKGRPGSPAFVHPGYETKNLYADYRGHDLAQLLPWENGSLTVHAGLRLGGGSVFARADDKAVQRDVGRFFGQGEDGAGLFNRTPVDAFRMSATPYAGTRLRERRLQQHWLLRWEDDVARVYRWDVSEDAAGWVENEREMRMTPALPNAWLALAPEEMDALCRAAGISPEVGMQVELAAGMGTEVLVYDGGFGIWRNPQER